MSLNAGPTALERAIERNKKKQLKKQLSTGGSSLPSSTSMRGSGTRGPRASRTSGLRSRLSQASQAQKSAQSSSRVKVAKGDDNVSFLSPLKKKIASVPKISYATSSQGRTSRLTRSSQSSRAKRGSSGDGPLSKVSQFFLFLGWGFCLVLFFRLIFADNGVVDFYKKKDLIENRLSKLERLKKENEKTLFEIEQMEANRSYQKKMARKHLGVIARDEYLILFAKEEDLSKLKIRRP